MSKKFVNCLKFLKCLKGVKCLKVSAAQKGPDRFKNLIAVRYLNAIEHFKTVKCLQGVSNALALVVPK